MIKALGIDIDGTMTDGYVYYLGNEEVIRFYRRDGHGIRLLMQKGVKVLVISGTDNKALRKRCGVLKTDFVLGIENKLGCIEEYLQDKKIDWNEFAYIGDDVNDLDVLKMAGFSAVPKDGELALKKVAKYICEKKGGEGCVREFINLLLRGKVSS